MDRFLNYDEVILQLALIQYATYQLETAPDMQTAYTIHINIRNDDSGIIVYVSLRSMSNKKKRFINNKKRNFLFNRCYLDNQDIRPLLNWILSNVYTILLQ